MTADERRARAQLDDPSCTCAVCKGDVVYTSSERGVKPLLSWLRASTDLSGFSAADRVVGKAAASLYVLLGVAVVYAPVMSEAGLAMLTEHGVAASYETKVPTILNRDRSACCPMEQAVAHAADPQQALTAITQKVAQLMANRA